jgi:hypothetical protein
VRKSIAGLLIIAAQSSGSGKLMVWLALVTWLPDVVMGQEN